MNSGKHAFEHCLVRVDDGNPEINASMAMTTTASGIILVNGADDAATANSCGHTEVLAS